MPDDRHDISTLNRLIAIILDSLHGIDRSSLEISSDAYARLLARRAAERTAIALRLQQEVETLGGKADPHGAPAPSVRSLAVSLKAFVTGNRDRTIIREIGIADEKIIRKFEDALGDITLSSRVLAVIETCFVMILDGCDETHRLAARPDE